jgi:plastocyanin
MRIVFATAIAVLAAISTPCLADTTVIEQSGKKFTQTEITIKKGDTVTYVNKDSITPQASPHF